MAERTASVIFLRLSRGAEVSGRSAWPASISVPLPATFLRSMRSDDDVGRSLGNIHTVLPDF